MMTKAKPELNNISRPGKTESKIPATSVIKPPTKKKKDKDKPKRPLSAYNFFFKEERGKIIKAVLSNDGAHNPQGPDHIDQDRMSKLLTATGNVSFEQMGKLIGQRWKSIGEKRLAEYSELASKDLDRYKKEMSIYNARQEEAKMICEAWKNGWEASSNGGCAFNPQSGGYPPPNAMGPAYGAPLPFDPYYMGIPPNSFPVFHGSYGCTVGEGMQGPIPGGQGGVPGGMTMSGAHGAFDGGGMPTMHWMGMAPGSVTHVDSTASSGGNWAPIPQPVQPPPINSQNIPRGGSTVGGY